MAAAGARWLAEGAEEAAQQKEAVRCSLQQQQQQAVELRQKLEATISEEQDILRRWQDLDEELQEA